MPLLYYQTIKMFPTVALANQFEPRYDKTNKVTVRPAKTQISLGIRPVWSESFLCAQLVAKDPRFLHADSEDSNQTGRMPRLIWVFTRRTLTLLVLSYRGSFVSNSVLWLVVPVVFVVSWFLWWQGTRSTWKLSSVNMLTLFLGTLLCGAYVIQI